jgi:hypothetical protein
MQKSTVLLLTGILFLSGCKHNPLDIDTSEVQTEPLLVKRLEKDLFSLEPNNISSGISSLHRKYGALLDHYFMNTLKIRGNNDSLLKESVLAFTHDKDVKEAFVDVQRMYSEKTVSAIAGEMDESVKRFKYHFPKRKLPSKLITCLSGWNYWVAYMDEALMLSLEMYLGDSSKFYQMLRMPQYQVRKMNRYHILPDLARGWLLTEFDTAMAENTLLHHAIFYGRIYYGVEALLPNTADSLIIGYSSKQMEQCAHFEKQYWSYMAEKNRLYQNDMNTIRELTSDGPFTGAISKECPPRIAMWIGWQIVRSYMKNNERVTLSELMNERDAQKILNKSKYRP